MTVVGALWEDLERFLLPLFFEEVLATLRGLPLGIGIEDGGADMRGSCKVGGMGGKRRSRFVE